MGRKRGKRNNLNGANLVISTSIEASKKLSYLNMVPVNLSSGEIPLYAEFLCPERDKLNLKISDHFSNSVIFGQQGVFLPCGPEQPLDQVDKVISCLYEFNANINKNNENHSIL